MDARQILEKIVSESVDTKQRGTRYERAVKFFLENDPIWSARLDKVWMWADAPTNGGDRGDYGIDLVAHDATDDSYWAIQAKCYRKQHLSEKHLGTFFGYAALRDEYKHLMVADTAPGWTRNLVKMVDGDTVGKEVVRITADDLMEANLDWDAFAAAPMSAFFDNSRRQVFDPRPHQQEAIDGIRAKLADHDRCLVVMACGTGKTLMALRAAETICPGGTVLFLAPSIALVSQSMREWSNQVRGHINPYVVCSDGTASRFDDEAYGTLMDLPFPATTNPHTVVARFKPSATALNVVFSTYQSIERVHEAQEMGLPDFDLVICDEAHRTTGVIDGETSFSLIHDAGYIRAAKRVYMTATPRVFGEETKKKAERDFIDLASMDNEATYGPVAYRLSFGKAVSEGLLTDYRIVVMRIAESMVSSTMQRLSARDDLSLDVPDVAKFLGCWKALFDRRHGSDYLDAAFGVDGDADADGEDRRVLRHAIAFAASIRASKALSSEFQTVIDTYLETIADEAQEGEVADVQRLVDEGRRVNVRLDHVDGGMDSEIRKEKLDWLAADEDDDTCHILSNARCLAEGVDVPDLDAVIYLSSRKSKVDIIQSVGRVMRRGKNKDKRYGYIIIPVFVPAGTDEQQALSANKDYKVVWEVVRALRSHDERLDAVINAGNFGDMNALKQVIEVEVLDESKLKSSRDRMEAKKHRIGESEPDQAAQPEAFQPEIPNLFDDVQAIYRAVCAKVVEKCGTKIYWRDWTGRVAHVTAARCEQIAALVRENPEVAASFHEFLEGIRGSLNDGFDERRAVETLAQHEVTRPIFVALFDNEEVVANNPITRGLDRALESLYEAGLPRSTDDRELAEVYASVRDQVRALTTDASRQSLVKEIYNEFFKAAFKDTSDALGIVYTPVEVVDAQLHMVQRALRREFDASLGDKDVHILDGFAGTGTYMCRLIEDESLIDAADLPYKYANDLHSNEIVPLAATIMDINIEQSYHSRTGGDYMPFPGALLTDTFQMSEDGDVLDQRVFTENTERVIAQQQADIRVIVGNPPYRAGDKDNTGNQNTKYPCLDSRIEKTYAAGSNAVLKNSLYDHYIRAFRWASDRIGNSGIVCFVSNGGWLSSEAGAGVRKCFASEFNSIYVYNLRGNARCSGKERQMEKDNVFGEGTRTTIAITMLVKNPASAEHGAIHYRDIGDYLTRDQKLKVLKECVAADPDWSDIHPDEHGDWLEKRENSFVSFAPMGVQEGTKKLPIGMFKIWSQGVKTNRDPWCYNYRSATVRDSMKRTVATYLSERERWHEAGKPEDVKSFLTKDDSAIKWTRELYADMARDKEAEYFPNHVRPSLYRPFCKQWLYMDTQFNNCVYQQPKLFPYEGPVNLEICCTGPGNNGFSCMISEIVPCLDMQQKSQCFPLYWYEEVKSASVPEPAGPKPAVPAQGSLFDVLKTKTKKHSTDESARWKRHDAITDTALKVFREAYPELADQIDKREIFFYVYGILHSPEYRERFGNNLKKELPRIPLARDFMAFCNAGHRLANLHLHYEGVPAWPSLHRVGPIVGPWKTTKMTWGRKVDPETGDKITDYTVLHVADNMTITDIPERAQEYVVNGKSALGWIVDRYKITTDKKSGIVNDPNLYSKKQSYIIDLVASVVTVSMETLDIVEALPPLDELPQPASWPAEWRS